MASLLAPWTVVLALLAVDGGPADVAPAPSPVAAAQPSVDPADVPTVGASLDRVDAVIGDRLVLTLSAVARPGLRVSLPKPLPLGKFEELDRDDGPEGGRDLGDGRRVFRFVVGLAAYEVGDLELPSIELSYLDAKGEVRIAKTDPLIVKIRGLINDGEDTSAPQPLRSPRSAMVEDERVTRAAKWGGIALGSSLALWIVVRLIKRFLRRRRRTDGGIFVDRTPRRPPEEVAMEALTRLRDQGNFALDGYRPFFFAVAEVVRAYVGGRYGFDSLELTTTELLDEVARRAPEIAREGGELARFLNDSDLVKFAQAGSSEGEALRALDAAQAFVLTTTAAKLEADKVVDKSPAGAT